jgi:hypothetical protein
MKLTGKIILAALFSLSIFALASPSEAWRGRAGHYGYRGHYRQHGHHTVKRHYGKKYHIKRSQRHYGHKPRVRHGYRGHRYGIHLGYGYGYYSRYGPRTYYRYPYRSRYYYRPFRVNRAYDRGYPDHYRNDSFTKYLWEFDVLLGPADFAYWPNLAI